MARRHPAAGIGIIHRRQIIMDQRVGIKALYGCRHTQPRRQIAVIGGITACCPVLCGKAACPQHQRGPHPLATIHRRIAHGRHQPVGRAIHFVEHVGQEPGGCRRILRHNLRE